jgi:hypothetical protein
MLTGETAFKNGKEYLLEMQILRLKLDNIEDYKNNNNNNKGILNLTFQQKLNRSKEESCNTYNCPAYFSHSFGLHANCFLAVLWVDS